MSKEATSKSAGPTSLPQMEAQMNRDGQRNLTGSLEQCKEELRDAYMSFKDLQTRCVVDLKRNTISSDDHPVYYFKPETFLLDDPEKQRQYRAELLKKVGSIPKPDPIAYLGDELHRSMCQTVADRSTPKATKALLCEFFRRRQYALQHMKYKLLCRWAHHNLTSENAENIGPEATFIYGKLEYNLEQAMLRNERLEQEDHYDKANPANRPSTRTSEPGGSSLYVEKFDLTPQSLVREDDIEVYMRGVAHRNKLNKVVNKFMARLKWLPMLNKQQIFESAISEHFSLKNKNIARQTTLHDQVQERAKRTLVMTAELQAELDQITESYYCKQHEKMFLTQMDRIVHFWKPNHDEVPSLIGDPFSLKLKILSAAALYNLLGDIELDNGFSFSYQVTVFFPTYFQKQVLKSQFSIYDAHEEDPNSVKKRTLNSMARIDTNIFRDVSTTKHTVPSDEAIQSELKDCDIKIMRLKSAVDWIDYVALTPSEPDWHQKQQAMLSSDNPTDTLLKSGFNFLDVNDLATVNRINEDNTQLHLKSVQKMHRFNPHDQIATKAVATSDGDKHLTINKMPIKQANNVAANIEAHLMCAVQDPKDEEEDEVRAPPKTNSLASMAGHLLTSYYTLRFIKSRDAKTRILYTLNYFRAIQKRLALDLREFASRDRIDSHFVNPFVQSKEANQIVINQANYTAKAHEKVQRNSNGANVQNPLAPKMTVFDSKAIEKMKNMASLRQYKANGLFNNRILSTCPSYPKHHSSHGEPVVTQPQNEEMDRDRINQGNMTGSALKLMGRIEFVEINEKEREVYIKDDFGIYIMYDCCLQDMKSLEEELTKIGSLFLHRSELLLDPTETVQGQRVFPARDRLEVIQDLLEREALFQFNKVKLVQVYMECYEHITDPLEQQKIMQVITDIMARRPRLNLNANYFVDAYDAEIKCLEKQFELAKMLVDMQVSLEKTENKRLQDSLNLSYHLANQYAQNKWQYQDAEALLACIAKKRKNKDNYQEGPTVITQNSEKNLSRKETPGAHSNQSKSPQNDLAETKQSSVIPESQQQMWGDESSVSLDDEDFLQDEQNKFSKLLGLPQISLESIYQTYHEKDINILKLMGEHSHFIACHEGYPEFLTRLTHKSIMDKNKEFKPNYWSQETGSLDFYETLDFITRFFAVTQQMQQELYDGLKMWEPTLLTQVDIQVAELSMQELRRVISVQEGSLVEYQGRASLEDEQVLGSSDRMIFYAKEMLADFTCKPKAQLDPFLMAKLDPDSLKFYDFPKLPQSLNKYVMRNNGVSGSDYMLKAEKMSLSGIAKDKYVSSDFTAQLSDLIEGKVGDAMNLRNLVVPTQLKTYCNMMEMHRLRSELMIAASETWMLSEIYLQQCDTVGQKQTKLLQSEGISFDSDLNDQEEKLVNYVDHGPAHMENIDLAVREFDPALLSNLNFRNPDAFKICILTSGLEELRAVLQYQLLQKHLLIVATRMNSLVMDSHVRAFSELNLLQSQRLALPNSIVRYQKVINKHQDTLNLNQIKSERSSYKLSLSSNCLPVFYNITNKKSQQRASIAKEFSSYQTTVVTALPYSAYAVLRVMRNYKLKLLTRFVQATLTEVYLDAQKVQAVHSCQRLRMFNRYFSFDPKKLGMSDEAQVVFKYETSPLIENFPSNYLPEQFLQDEKPSGIGAKQPEVVKVLVPSSYEIVDYSAIPSSTSLLTVDASPIEDLRLFKQKRFEARARVWGEEVYDDLKSFDLNVKDLELHLKRMLPTFTPDEHFETSMGRKSPEEIDQIIKKKIGLSAGSLLDYEEALYFGDSKFASMSRYYQQLERIVTIEWFLNKLQFRPEEVICIENAIECGLPFWRPDEFDARVASEVQPADKSTQKGNKRAYEFFYDQVVSLRQKRNMAEVVMSFALTMKSFIAQYKKTREEQRFEYLSQYTEFRYQQVVGSMHKLVQQFYYQKNMGAVKTIRQAITNITRMGHVKVVYLQPNNYSVNHAVVAPDSYSLESGNFIYGSVQHEDVLNFKRCVQPVVNEKALEPPQTTLFQSLYQQDYLRRSYPSQFAGQFTSMTNTVPFKAMEYALLALTPQERQYSQSFIAQAKNQANDFMETVFNDTSMASLTKEEVYNMGQLVDAKKFINESTQALLLRNALICWFENSTLPDSAQVYEKFESNFRQNYFWKQLEQKEELTKKLQLSGNFGQIPSHEQIKEMKLKIDALANDQNLATQSEMQKRDAIVKALREEFASLKKKVTLDNYFNMKAEIYVFSNEIEKFMIRASVKTLDAECNALAKCFAMQVPKIQYHIHPFQQFAATFFDQCDPNMHLDVSNRVTAVQVLLTKMRNRSTEVETLTSGPGMVFTIKDINDILQDFCRQTIKDQEKQFKSRSETSHLMEENYRSLIYVKDQKIKTLEHRMRNIGINLENIIDARLFEKGNQLIYELDSSNRILSLYKGAMHGLENRLAEKILGEQMQKFKRQSNEIDLKNQKFGQYKNTIVNMINADWAEDAERIKVQLKQKADMAKITDKQHVIYKKLAMYPGQVGHSQSAQAQEMASVVGGVMGAVVPKGFQHYSNCSCYVPDPNHPRPTMELAELEMLSEREAREELSKVCSLIRKQRVLYRTKEMCMMTKYQDQINLLKKQLNNNSTLWEQLSESEKRERVLRQELLYTQQSLSASEKTIGNLKEEIKGIDAERVRLLNFKTSQYDRLKELEVKVNKYDLFDNVDTDKLLMALARKDAQLSDIKSTQLVHQNLYEAGEAKRLSEVNKLRTSFRNEQHRTQTIVDKMEQMKLELKMLETNDTSVANIWKKKCLDLFDVCQSMKSENEELRDRCKELINQGIDLAEAVAKNESTGTYPPRQQVSSVNVLPNLSKNDSQLKMTKFTNSTNTKDTRALMYSTANSLQQKQFSDTFSKGKGLSSELVIPNEQLVAWGFSSSIDTSSGKKVPMTQQRNRTLAPPLDYTSSVNHNHNHKPQVRPGNDIKSIISGAQVSLTENINNRKRFGSTDQQFTNSLNVSSQQNSTSQSKRRQVVQDSLMTSSYGAPVALPNKTQAEGTSNFRKPQGSITFDLKGTAFAQQQLGSPRTRLLQQSRKQSRLVKQDKVDALNDYSETQRISDVIQLSSREDPLTVQQQHSAITAGTPMSPVKTGKYAVETIQRSRDSDDNTALI